MTPIRAALRYAALGIPVFPVWNVNGGGTCACPDPGGPKCAPGKHPMSPFAPGGFKDATTDVKTIQRWWTEWPDANIGGRMGEEAGLIAVDLDDGGVSSLRAVEAKHGPLPEGPRTRTPGGPDRGHLFFRWPGGDVAPKTNVLPGVDIRGRDSYVVLPPSTHVNGRYEWLVPYEGEAPLPPGWFVRLLSEGRRSQKSLAAPGNDEPIPEGQRHNTLLSIAGRLRDWGLGDEAILAHLREVNERRCVPPKDDRLVVRLARDVARRYEPTRDLVTVTVEGGGESFRDAVRNEQGEPDYNAAAQWFMDRHDFIHPPAEGKPDLLVYRPERGVWVNEGNPLIRATVRRLADFKVTSYFVEETLKAVRDSSIIEKEGGGFVDWTDFDRAPGITVANGVIDPFHADGPQLTPWSPDRLDLSSLPVAWNPEAACPRWSRALEEWFAGNEACIPLFQEAFGYSLIRDHRFHRWFLLYGKGGNGKGTAMSVLKALVGDENVSSVSIQRLCDENDRFANASMVGRLVNIGGDIPDKPLRHTGRLKELTGEDSVAFERKFRDPFYRQNTCKLWFLGNEVPMTDDDTDAFYRRVTPIPFDNQFVGEEKDEDLRDKLKEELEGVLVWAVEGLRRLYENGRFSDARTIDERREEYRRISDNVYGFVRSHAEVEVGRSDLVTRDLWSAYTRYCAKNGEKPVGRQTFEERIEKHVPEAYKDRARQEDGSRPWVWHNLGVRE